MFKKIGVGIPVILFLILFIIPLVLSINTQVYIKEVKPNYEVTVNILNPDSGDAITYLNGTSNSAGELTSNFSSEKTTVNLYVIVRNLGKIVQTKKFDGYSTLNPIIISMGIKPTSSPTPSVNNTPAPVVNTTTTVNTTPATTPPATNSNLSTNKTNVSSNFFIVSVKNLSSKIPWKIILYVILGIIALVVLIFLFIFAKNKIKIRYPYGINSKVHLGFKLSTKSSSGLSSSEERALRAAEEKIRLAQEEINKIRHRKEKIKEVEMRLEQDKRELERLKSRF